MIRLYLDEMFSPILTRIVQGPGIDTASSVERGHVSTPDNVHLRLAAAEGRCVVTNNFDDFVRLTNEMMERGEPHAGVLLVPNTLAHGPIGALATALLQFAREHPNGLPPYTVMWLQRVAE